LAPKTQRRSGEMRNWDQIRRATHGAIERRTKTQRSSLAFASQRQSKLEEKQKENQQ
jgi:hypothetical protein